MAGTGVGLLPAGRLVSDSANDMLNHCGSKIFSRIPFLYDLMREYLPELDWDRVDPHRRLTAKQILAWADAYHSRHGRWPTNVSGTIPESGDSWHAVNSALRGGWRGLPGGSSLLIHLRKHRGVSTHGKTRFTEKQILAWADAYLAEHGKWPSHNSGPITGTAETWLAVDAALRRGTRGLRGNSSVARLLARQRAKRNPKAPPAFVGETDSRLGGSALGRLRYLAQRGVGADHGYYGNLGQHPSGRCGKAGAASVPAHHCQRLLSEHRGVRNHKRLPPLTEEQILQSARRHFERTAQWPNDYNGLVADSPADTSVRRILQH